MTTGNQAKRGMGSVPLYEDVVLNPPRWTISSVLAAALLTFTVFLALPYLERLSQVSRERIKPLRVDTTRAMAPPPMPPPVEEVRPVEEPRTTPKPRLRPVPRMRLPVSLAMNLDLALGAGPGDYSVEFPVMESLASDMETTTFSLADLDEPPRPVVQLRPLYPPHARMRRIQGFVEIEFTVMPDGRAADVAAVASEPGDTFVDAAVRAVKRWRFQPGTLDGNPVAVRVRQKVRFRLED